MVLVMSFKASPYKYQLFVPPIPKLIEGKKAWIVTGMPLLMPNQGQSTVVALIVPKVKFRKSPLVVLGISRAWNALPVIES